MFAIAEHDRGWIDLDESPFWNDKTQTPYSFIDFPMVPRAVFYKKGIDEVESQSLYAGLLCSMHYQSFLTNAKEPAVQKLFKHEEARQSRLRKQLNLVEAAAVKALQFHFQLTQFCDNLSLYLCIQEPGTPKEQEFPWFKDGFPEIFPFTGGKKIIAEWVDDKTVSLHPFPLHSETPVSVRAKKVKKADIRQRGLVTAYKGTQWETVFFSLVEK